jgi:hypothetical protein
MTKDQFKRWAQMHVRSWIDPDCSLEEEWQRLIAFLEEDKTPLSVRLVGDQPVAIKRGDEY